MSVPSNHAIASAAKRLRSNGVLGNDDQGSGQIVGHSEVILRSLSTISNGKSLAPYRDCLGGKDTGTVICWGRGSFDRGDLKEAAGAAVRAMEPQAGLGDAGIANRDRCVRTKARGGLLGTAGRGGDGGETARPRGGLR